MKFTHLHLHTHYSLLDGLIKPKDLVQKIKAEGGDAVAITDHGVMYGVIDFYKECKKEGIKPIIGCEVYVAPNGRHNKRAKFDEKNYHILLLAKNNIGYQNLIKLVSIAHLEGFYYKPRIDDELLEQYSEGLICLSGCLGSEIPTAILSGQEQKAKDKIKYFKNLFGADSFYLELQHHPSIRAQKFVNDALIKLSKEFDVPLVATNDAHYLNKDDADAQDVLICLQTKRKKKEVSRMTMLGEDFSVRSHEEMVESFADTPEAVTNTNKIAEMCNVEIVLGEYQLPYFAVPDNYDEIGYLAKLCHDGLQQRYGTSYDEIDDEKKNRLDYELEVIKKMGYPSYFLIVADLVVWSKEQGIVVGPGRGSAAGSFVSYLLGITDLDPIEYELLFERFLNPERVSMPDIDLDFADVRREEVIHYVEDKYGKDHVAQIITFATMAARAAVRDVGRVLDFPYELCDSISKAMPMFNTIEQALKTPELKQLYEQQQDVRTVVDYAKKIEGVIRHASVHACGVLITKEAVTEYAPVQYVSSSENQSMVSQYSLHPVEDLGLLKMDFLGLKNLTIIEAALKIIRKTKNIAIDINKIPIDNKKAYELLQRGASTGVFQLESAGMKRYLKELKPTEFEDIIAMVALYRPGPMEWIPDYINGKHGRKKLKYLHPKLEPILRKTYGVAIYQEQVMQMARDLAGFTMGEADVLRKAMGKKIVKLLEAQKNKFVDGCVKNGIPSELALEIFTFIEPFAGYGFNRSHAACYALVGYQTAYLKANYPTEFMSALMTADQEDIERVPIMIDECNDMGIEVLAPDVSESFSDFAVVPAKEGSTKETIRFGLRAIKNVGAHITEVIIEERKARGSYKDIPDFLNRVQDKDLKKKSLESLIKVGAFDALAERGVLLANLDRMLDYSRNITHARNRGQDSLFTLNPDLEMQATISLEAASPADKQIILAWEKELLGLYLSDHPFRAYENLIGKKIRPLHAITAANDEQFYMIAGFIGGIKKIVTKKNETMMFVKLEDKRVNRELIVFPSFLKKDPELWVEGKAIIVHGKVSTRDNETKIITQAAAEITLDNAITITEEFIKKNINKTSRNNNWRNFARSNNDRKKILTNMPLTIQMKSLDDTAVLQKLKECLLANKGESKVILKINDPNNSQIIETSFRVANDNNLKTKLVELLGSGAV